MTIRRPNQVFASRSILHTLRAMAAGLAAAVLFLGADRPVTAATIMVVVGAEGAPEYGRLFSEWLGLWRDAAQRADAKLTEIGAGEAGAVSDRDQLQQALEAEEKDGSSDLWLVLIGHGTSDGRTARFNLRGPDFSDADLAGWLAPFQRTVVVVNFSASSGPFLNRLSHPGRVVVTATRSSNEQSFARFGGYFSGALADTAADYDRDGQISLLEAYLAASRRVAEFYRTESRLATEHALLDDNGDGLGTPGDWFRGVRAVKRARDGAAHDGHRAHQIVLIPSERERRIPTDLRAERDRLELAVAELRDRKETLEQNAYYSALESILRELAHLQLRIDQSLEAAAVEKLPKSK